MADDINEKLVHMWREDSIGGDLCNAMTDRLNGILSLEATDETRPLYEELEARGFDYTKVSELISQECAAAEMLAEELPEEPVATEVEAAHKAIDETQET